MAPWPRISTTAPSPKDRARASPSSGVLTNRSVSDPAASRISNTGAPSPRKPARWNTGRSRAAITSEIDRYCASPGQACGYKIGHNEIVRQRARARALLGDRFDLRDFNDAVIQTGGVPLTALPGVINQHQCGLFWWPSNV